jgi:ribosomal protein S18 acetylase RimI-like enzyme
VTDAELDNPFWSSLDDRHGGLALRIGGVARFPPEHAPFLGVADADVDVGDALESLVAPGESVYLLGVAPRRLPGGFRLEPLAELAQMVCPARVDAVDGDPVVPLSAAHRDEVLALTALVYPHYFRPRTMELGRYFGIHREGRLAAMIGERLGTDRHQEISAVCTHPDFLGQGHARRLLAWLSNDVIDRGRLPFLHVSRDNVRAVQLYERNGYRLRRTIPFWSLRRG